MPCISRFSLDFTQSCGAGRLFASACIFLRGETDFVQRIHWGRQPALCFVQGIKEAACELIGFYKWPSTAPPPSLYPTGNLHNLCLPLGIPGFYFTLRLQ